MSRLLKALRAPFRLFRSEVPLVQVVELQGAIAPSSRGSKSMSAASVDSGLVKAFKNKDAKAVVIAINSPGGSPAQARMISERIRLLSIEKQIPAYAYIEDIGASGGYMIAVAGEEIWADPFAIVGSIGVISAGFGFQELIEKAGVERRVHTAGTNKMRLDPFQPQKDEDRAKLKAILDKTHALFIEMVKTRRGERIKGPDDTVFSGDFFLAGEGRELGLVDEIGDLRALLKERFGHDVKINRISAQRSGLLARLGAGLSGGLVDAAAEKAEEQALRAQFGR
ncbi:MAG: S49 family peptidase [Pseudomonadota bacterium]